MTRHAAQRGFTTIELLITMVVIAVLASVAYPSYQTAVMKSRRSEAKAALTDAAQRLERFYTENNKYTGALFCSTGAACTAAVKVYEDKSENGYYALSFDANSQTVTTFTAVATPQGAQATDACGSFTLKQSGERGVTGPGADVAKCW